MSTWNMSKWIVKLEKGEKNLTEKGRLYLQNNISENGPFIRQFL
jgi:hypothetical protein